MTTLATTDTIAARPIPTPGIFYDVPAETYFAWDAVNASFLKKMAQSAAHARWETDNPKDPTPAMIQGSCTHAAILEPDKLESRYIVAQTCGAWKKEGGACSNNGKIFSDGMWYCGVHSRGRHADTIPGQIGEDGELINNPIVTLDQMAKARAMSISVQKNRASKKLLEPCRKEVCIVWTDHVTGILCKARLDAYNDVDYEIPDVKTCEDASPDAFPKTIADFGYDIQAAFYVDAAMALDGIEHDKFYFIAVEKNAPYVCAVYKAHQELIKLGRHRYRNLLADVKWCKENNYWPGYHDHQIAPVGVPHWHFERESKK